MSRQENGSNIAHECMSTVQICTNMYNELLLLELDRFTSKFAQHSGLGSARRQVAHTNHATRFTIRVYNLLRNIGER